MSLSNRLLAKFGKGALELFPFASEGVKFVNGKEDLPKPVGGVITLKDGITYYFITDIDLGGDRFETNGVVTILGTSSETASITSTGLADSTPLLTSRYTLSMRDITLKDVHTGIYIDDNGGDSLALNWVGVNFLNVSNVGEIASVDNFIYDTGAFLGSQNLRFTGEVGTVGAINSLFQGDGSAKPIIEVAATANITRRFRIIYSSVVAFGSTVGIDVKADSTIPIEGFILDTINFSGGGTFLGGVNFDDERASFTSCKGVTNTTAIAQMFMKNNETETVVTTQGDRYPVAGTSETTTELNQKFTHILADNALRYDSSVPRLFKVSLTFTVLAPQNNQIGIYLGRTRSGDIRDANADRRPESEAYITTGGSRPDAGSIQTLIELAEGDEIYAIVQNISGTGNITMEFMNMIVERTN